MDFLEALESVYLRAQAPWEVQFRVEVVQWERVVKQVGRMPGRGEVEFVEFVRGEAEERVGSLFWRLWSWEGVCGRV